MNKTKPAKNEKIATTADHLFKLEQSVGQFMQYWGFKKIHGRIWSHLYISTKPLDSITIMKRLSVSKGLMSLALRDLLKYNVILPVSTGRHGTVLYKANVDLKSIISNVLLTRETNMLINSRLALEGLINSNEADLTESSIDFDKIRNLHELTQSAEELLKFFMGSQPGNLIDFFNFN